MRHFFSKSSRTIQPLRQIDPSYFKSSRNLIIKIIKSLVFFFKKLPCTTQSSQLSITTHPFNHSYFQLSQISIFTSFQNIYPSNHPSYPYIHPFKHSSFCSSQLSICSSFQKILAVHLFIFSTIRLCNHSNYPSIHPSYPSIHPFNHLSI